MKTRRRNMWAVAGLVLGLSGTGCATRGFVRNEVGANAAVLEAGIRENTARVEETREEIDQLRSVDLQHSEDITRTQDTISATRGELSEDIEEVRIAVATAQGVAVEADERSRDLAGMFADRGHLEIRDSHEIYFGFASSTIEPEHSTVLEAISAQLRADPNTILLLEGRTDSTGDPAFNTRLGQNRVDAAMGYMVLELNVPVHRIHTFSYGEARPAYGNDTPEEREKNRSVKLIVLGPADSTAIASLPE